jgi:hypothetical protein
MVRSINEIGHLTGKQTIAEFAENPEIINMLQSPGRGLRSRIWRLAAATGAKGLQQRLSDRRAARQ